ncbi:hypothetical protein [Mesorhizobium sp. LNJC405B00]|uniref:hypothetical protein n=1 Tax=unclassified Mesorhizobium TaxID=325217 RepID=UPI0003CE70E2|nr:hypothetical protein [Mesorhizobium sp. LNJC405B00]ESX95993.1 hypothetical protein X755_20900 [Mesorhizobium sp. LNJC405B00]
MSEWCSEAEAFARAEIRFPGVSSIRPALAYAIDAGQIAKRGGRRAKRRLDFIPILSPGENAPGYWDDRAVEINIRDLEHWLQKMAGTSEKASGKNADRSFTTADAPLVEKMRPHVQGGMSPSAAALLFVDEATGGGETVSKQRRLQRAYSKVYGVT